MATVKKSISFNPSWLGLVGVIFVLCKILEIGVVATWSWWIVLMPFYIGLAILLFIVGGGAALVGIVFAGAWVMDKYEARKRRIARAKEDTWRALNRKN